jgi:fermentation-respiration switch protein FrsA (DUF1100 family)
MTRPGARDKIRGVLWTLFAAATVALLVATTLVVLVWWKQESITFQPPGPPYPRVTARRVDYAAADGQPLYGYVVGDRERARGLLLAFHGNADLAGWQIPWAEEVARRTGWLVLAAEYRGYGGLAGRPTYEGSRLDARAAYAVARDSLGFAPEQIAIFGHSLGSAVATELASEVRPRVLLLQSPFSSARAMARVIVWRPVLLAWSMISRIHFDTRHRVAELDTPVWVAHGDRDFVIPVRMGREVFGAARTPGELLIVRGAGHNDVGESGGTAYWRWMERALGANGVASGQ